MSDIKNSSPTEVLNWPEIPGKLKKIIQDSGLSLPAFAKKVGVSRNTLVSYRDGQTSPSIYFLAKVCMEFSVSNVWLILGKGEPYRSIEYSETPIDLSGHPNLNIVLLQEIIEAIEESLNKSDLELASQKKAQLISLLYEHFVETNKTVNKGTVTRYLKLVA